MNSSILAYVNEADNDIRYLRVVDVLNARMISDAERAVTQRLTEAVNVLRVRLVSGVDVKRVSRTTVHSISTRLFAQGRN